MGRAPGLWLQGTQEALTWLQPRVPGLPRAGGHQATGRCFPLGRLQARPGAPSASDPLTPERALASDWGARPARACSRGLPCLPSPGSPGEKREGFSGCFLSFSGKCFLNLLRSRESTSIFSHADCSSSSELLGFSEIFDGLTEMVGLRCGSWHNGILFSAGETDPWGRR